LACGVPAPDGDGPDAAADAGWPDADADGATDAGDALADRGPATSDAGGVAALRQLGVLRTLAGRGFAGDKGVNGWRPEFEGALATEVELSRPHTAMADAAGNVYIADKDAHAVRIVGLDGRIRTLAGTNVAGDGPDGPATTCALSAPNGLFVSPGGVVHILDLRNAKVRRVEGGRISTVFTDPHGLGTGRGLWVDGEAIYYAAGSEVRRYTPGAGIETLADGFVSLGNIAMDAAGRLAITDRGGHRVWRIEADGRRTPIAGTGRPQGAGDEAAATEIGLDEPRGIFFHPDGGYFLGTHDGSQVWFVDPDGVAHLVLDGAKDDDTHAGDGERWDRPGRKVSEVRAVTLTPNGALLVTENDRGFVRAVEP